MTGVTVSHHVNLTGQLILEHGAGHLNCTALNHRVASFRFVPLHVADQAAIAMVGVFPSRCLHKGRAGRGASRTQGCNGRWVGGVLKMSEF